VPTSHKLVLAQLWAIRSVRLSRHVWHVQT